MRIEKSAVLAAALFFFVACGRYVACPGRPPSTSGAPRVELNTAANPVTIDIAALPSEVLNAARNIHEREVWSQIFTVKVDPDQPPMLGDYAIASGRIRFTPMFPLDPGRRYYVAYTPAGFPPVTGIVGLAATHTEPTTVVAQVYPSGEIVPENQLRLYIHFSAPMGMKGGLDYVHLLDDQGKEVKDPFLPLDAEFWNGDRTRYTVFFDPGRQKRGIPVIEEMGRSLTEGRSYTIVVDKEWRDGNGLPLKASYRRTVKVGPPDERPLDHKSWKVHTPPVGTRAPLLVEFPEALDHGLLRRAMGVEAADGNAVSGEIAIANSERTWSFTPREMWRPDTYRVVVLGMLEDLAGNRIGRAFEVDQFDRSDKSPEPEKTLIPFAVR